MFLSIHLSLRKPFSLLHSAFSYMPTAVPYPSLNIIMYTLVNIRTNMIYFINKLPQ